MGGRGVTPGNSARPEQGRVTPGNTARQEQTGKRSVITTIMFALLFVALVGEAPVEFDTSLYNGQWRSVFAALGPLFTPIPGISLQPWQLLLIVLVPFCLGASATRLHAREMDRAIFVSAACVAVTFLWGLVQGGSAYFAYYQLWRWLAALLIAYMLMSVVRTERDLASLGKLVILSALIRAALCMYYYWAHLRGKVDPLPEYVISHDDSILFVAAIQIASFWAVLKGGKAAWTVAIIVSAFVMYAILLNSRRIAYVELVFSLPLIYVLIGASPLRKRIVRWAMMLAPVVLVYFIAGAVSDSSIFAPVHALTSTGDYNDPSSLTREEEIRNLLRTLVDYGNPIMGTGWGRPYIKIESVYSNYAADWILVLYTPHNSIVGLAAFSGLIGIVGIWGIMPVSGYLAARGYRNSTGMVARTAAMAAIGTLVTYSVQCYGDIGLQSFQGAVMLGGALATVSRVAMLSEAVASPNTAAAQAADALHAPVPRPTYRRPRPVPAPTRRLSR